jgi:hypothetical protein
MKKAQHLRNTTTKPLNQNRMKTEDKAIDLINKFGKELASKVVDEIIDALELYDTLTESNLRQEFGLEYFSSELQNMDNDFRYWDKVKKQLTFKSE